jgi:hypothetical protein
MITPCCYNKTYTAIREEKKSDREVQLNLRTIEQTEREKEFERMFGKQNEGKKETVKKQIMPEYELYQKHLEAEKVKQAKLQEHRLKQKAATAVARAAAATQAKAPSRARVSLAQASKEVGDHVHPIHTLTHLGWLIFLSLCLRASPLPLVL